MKKLFELLFYTLHTMKYIYILIVSSQHGNLVNEFLNRIFTRKENIYFKLISMKITASLINTELVVFRCFLFK